MIFKATSRFLSAEKKTSKKTNNEYVLAALMVGTETVNLMSDVPIICVFGDEINVTFELNLKYNQLKILGYELCKK